MIKQKFSLALLSISLLMSGCANYHIRQGNHYFNDLAYNKAIPEYQKGLSKKTNDAAQISLAESFRKMNNLPKAEEEYAKVVLLKDAQPIHKLRYAQMLMRSEKYVMASSYFDLYLQANPTDESVRRLKASCDSVEGWKKDSAKYTIQTSMLNTGQSNFSPVWYKDGIAFTSDRNTAAKTYEWTGRPFLELYYSKGNLDNGFAAPKAFAGLNGLYHDGPATFNATGDTVYFTRNNYEKKKVQKSSADIVDLKIYRAVKKDTLWGNITEFEYNSKEYSNGHPSMNEKGTKMYFVSDMPGGLGGTDIYVVEKMNGTWSKPVNLGPSINTPYNEMFPTIWKDSILYFSSEGHYNMGGLDIFSSTLNGSSWSDARNMGYPMNTSYDDFGIALNDNATAGILSSNRNSKNTTQDNLYNFTINDVRFTLEGIAIDKATQQPVEGVLAELTNLMTGKKESIITGPDGKFKFKLNPQTNYSVVGSKDGYFTNTEPVTTVGKNRSEDMFVKLRLELERIIVNKPIVLKNIYYDLDKWDIREDAGIELDRLVQILKENPMINIELGSHTDSRADDKYNLILSQKRAEAAVNYIVSKGISSSRMVAKGYGESELVNRCSNDVKCTEEEHQANRRTEFRVTSMSK